MARLAGTGLECGLTLPFTPGWDLVGVVDKLGDGISGLEPGRMVAALPISGAYAEFVCLPQREPVPVPSALRLACIDD